MLYVGTSGYSFREWVGQFYPPKTAANQFLSFYASQLRSVEINHTFRRFPTQKLLRTWAEKTPESFVFSVKMHQSVTHVARLKNVGDSVEDFLKALEPLGPRQGVVLFQLPPYFRADIDRLKSFLRELPRGSKYAVEFRHESWNETTVIELLRDAGVARCAAEVELGGTDVSPTATHAYMRLRKAPPYTDKEMRSVQTEIRKLMEHVEDLYVYVKHDDDGLAPEICLQLQALETGGGKD